MSECSLDCENFGLFVRGSFLYDDLVEDSQTDRTPISESGKDLAGSYLRLLDAFVYGRWDLAGHELDIRAGRQVFNWGKSTFCPAERSIIRQSTATDCRLDRTRRHAGSGTDPHHAADRHHRLERRGARL